MCVCARNFPCWKLGKWPQVGHNRAKSNQLTPRRVCTHTAIVLVFAANTINPQTAQADVPLWILLLVEIVASPTATDIVNATAAADAASAFAVAVAVSVARNVATQGEPTLCSLLTNSTLPLLRFPGQRGEWVTSRDGKWLGTFAPVLFHSVFSYRHFWDHFSMLNWKWVFRYFYFLNKTLNGTGNIKVHKISEASAVRIKICRLITQYVNI